MGQNPIKSLNNEENFLIGQASEMLLNGKPTGDSTQNFCTIGKVYGNYEVISKIGEGAYGQVFKVIRVSEGSHQQQQQRSSSRFFQIPTSPLSTTTTTTSPKGSLDPSTVFKQEFRKSTVRTYYAMKVMVIMNDEHSASTNPHSLSKIENEINILRSLEHKNILKYVDQFYLKVDLTPKIKKDAIALVSEYCEGGSLGDIIDLNQSSNIPLRKLVEWFTCMVDVLYYFEQKGVIHRDIKPGNLLLQGGVVKLADFGLAKTVEEASSNKNHTVCGSPIYVSPEVMFRAGYSSKADVYSLGITFLEVCSGVSHDMFSEYFKTEKIDLQPLLNRVQLSSLKTLLSLCIPSNPSERISVEQLHRHPIIQAYLYLLYGKQPKDPRNLTFIGVIIGSIELIYKSREIHMNAALCNAIKLINDVLPNQTILDSIYEGEHTNFIGIILKMGTVWSTYDNSDLEVACEHFLKKYMESGYLYKQHLAEEIVTMYYDSDVPQERLDWFLETHLLQHVDGEMVSMILETVKNAEGKLRPNVAKQLEERLSKLEVKQELDIIDEI
nr:unnamed protein product [Naegleria fowleri]